jgi:acylphosphatase
MAEAERFVVSGRVQGVGYRAFVRREAERLGLSGHALNLPDGRVEVLAIGAAGAREALARALARGPVLARVERVERSPADGEPTGRFVTG